jgi:HlyD family secretion protein
LSNSKFLLLTVAAALLGLLAWQLELRSRPAVVPRTERPLPMLISAPGRIAGSGEELRLRLPIAGRVAEVAVAEGQFVAAGQLLVRLENEQYVRQHERAQAELDAATGRLRLLLAGSPEQQRGHAEALYQAQLAELNQVALTLERAEQLRRGNVVTQQEFDDQQAHYQVLLARVAAAKAQVDLLRAPPRPEETEVAKAQVEAARAEVALALVALEQSRLVAPQTGQILQVNVRPGETADFHAPHPAVVLADTRHYRVRAFVEEVDAPRVAVGMPARITADGWPARKLAARVASVSPAIGPKRLWTGDPGERLDSDVREVWLDVEQTAGMLVGLRVDVLIDARPQDKQRTQRKQSGPVAEADGAAGRNLIRR